jgi:hypothetical protein
MENDLPINIGSKIAPNITCTIVIERIKKNNVLVGSNSTTTTPMVGRNKSTNHLNEVDDKTQPQKIES